MNFGKEKMISIAVVMLMTVSAVTGGLSFMAGEVRGGLLDPGALMVHAPIVITSDADFTNPANGISNTGAAGTPTDPYIIENWTISGGNATGCIEISKTSKHFIIKNCYLTNASSGKPAIYVYGTGANPFNSNYSVENCLFRWNAMSFGHYGVANGYQIPSDVLIKNCTFLDTWQSYAINAQGYHVQTISMGGNMTIENCDFSNAYAVNVGILYSQGDLFLKNLNITGNTFYSSVGALQYLAPNWFMGRFNADNVTINGGGGGSGPQGCLELNDIRAGVNLTNVNIKNGPGYGLKTTQCKYINMTGCTIDNMVGQGLYMNGDVDNQIVENTITNAQWGLYLDMAVSKTEFSKNTVKDCDNGIFWGNGQINNKFWSNAVYNNTNYNIDAGFEFAANNNRWNKTYSNGGGNYWGDYAGVDNYSGPNQDIPGADGIGDSNYTLRSTVFPWVVDYYPLMANPLLPSASIDYIVITDGPNNSSGPAPSNTTANPWFNITIWTAGFNNTFGYIGDVNVTWSVANYGTATASVANLTGNATTFQAGANSGVCLLTAEYAPGIIDQVNITIANYLGDLIINGKGGDMYENPPVTQVDSKLIGLGGTAAYPITVQNDGDADDHLTLVWDISSLPAGWTATMINMDNGTDITQYLNSGSVTWGPFAPGESDDLMLYLNSTATDNFGEIASIGIGLFSSGNQDSAGAIAQVMGLDYILLTDSPNGTELANLNIGSGEHVVAYASGYNSTGPTYIGLVEVTWTDAPDLGTFSNATGTSSNFTAGGIAGITLITGQNTAHSVSDNFTVNITVLDAVPPTTVFTCGAPNYTAGNILYVNSTTQLNLSAEDAGSGVANIMYRIDSRTWTTYAGNFTENAAGVHMLSYYAIDNDGNIEDTKFLNFTVDKTAPVSHIEFGMPSVFSDPTYVRSTTLFNITSNDTYSGVDTIWYRIDNGTWTLYASNFIVTAAGSHHIDYYAVDELGQDEAPMALEIFVDDLAPVVSASPAGMDGTLQINTTTSITLSASDAGVGEEIIFYSIDGGSTWLVYSTPISVGSNITIMYYAVDALANTADTQTLAVTYVPALPPAPPADDSSFIDDYWWIFIIIPFLLLLLLLLLLGKRKKCTACSKKSAHPEDEGWEQVENGDWYCDECKDHIAEHVEAPKAEEAPGQEEKSEAPDAPPEHESTE